MRFIRSQLSPTFSLFGGFGNPYFLIDFVPYGKASTTVNPDGSYSFDCQHGARECAGNIMHSCALRYLPASSGPAFINCSMSSSNPPAAGPSCAQTLGLDFSSVEKCISQDGPALLAANGERTHSLHPQLYFVPWILYDGIFSQSDLNTSLSKFQTLVCEKLGTRAPPACNGILRRN